MTIRHQHYRRMQYSPKFSVIFFGFSLALLFISVGFYLSSANAIAISGNAAHRFEKRIEDLSKVYRQSQVEMAQLTSLHRLKEKEGDFRPITPEEILYIAGSGPIAFR